MLIKYIGGISEIFIPAANLYMAHGQSADVPDDIAGSAPDGDDLGAGLLAQVDNFAMDGE